MCAYVCLHTHMDVYFFLNIENRRDVREKTLEELMPKMFPVFKDQILIY